MFHSKLIYHPGGRFFLGNSLSWPYFLKAAVGSPKRTTPTPGNATSVTLPGTHQGFLLLNRSCLKIGDTEYLSEWPWVSIWQRILVFQGAQPHSLLFSLRNRSTCQNSTFSVRGRTKYDKQVKLDHRCNTPRAAVAQFCRYEIWGHRSPHYKEVCPTQIPAL